MPPQQSPINAEQTQLPLPHKKIWGAIALIFALVIILLTAEFFLNLRTKPDTLSQADALIYTDPVTAIKILEDDSNVQEGDKSTVQIRLALAAYLTGDITKATSVALGVISNPDMDSTAKSYAVDMLARIYTLHPTEETLNLIFSGEPFTPLRTPDAVESMINLLEYASANFAPNSLNEYRLAHFYATKALKEDANSAAISKAQEHIQKGDVFIEDLRKFTSSQIGSAIYPKALLRRAMALGTLYEATKEISLEPEKAFETAIVTANSSGSTPQTAMEASYHFAVFLARNFPDKNPDVVFHLSQVVGAENFEKSVLFSSLKSQTEKIPQGYVLPNEREARGLFLSPNEIGLPLNVILLTSISSDFKGLIESLRE